MNHANFKEPATVKGLRIVDSRPIATLEALLRVKGMGNKRLQKIGEQVSI